MYLNSFIFKRFLIHNENKQSKNLKGVEWFSWWHSKPPSFIINAFEIGTIEREFKARQRKPLEWSNKR